MGEPPAAATASTSSFEPPFATGSASLDGNGYEEDADHCSQRKQQIGVDPKVGENLGNKLA